MSINAKIALHGKTFKAYYTETKAYCEVSMSDMAWRAFLKNHYNIEYRPDLGGFYFTAKQNA